jgi:hypothetical protein
MSQAPHYLLGQFDGSMDGNSVKGWQGEGASRNQHRASQHIADVVLLFLLSCPCGAGNRCLYQQQFTMSYYDIV